MSWAEVKKINSDMSMSLDILFRNSIRLLNSETEIYQVVSAPFFTVQEENTETITKTAIHQKIKFGCSGTAYLDAKADLSLVNNSGGYSVDKYEYKIDVVKNGNVYFSKIIATLNGPGPDYGDVASASGSIVNFLIAFQPNDVYEIKYSYTFISGGGVATRNYSLGITPTIHIKAVPIIGGFELIKEV